MLDFALFAVAVALLGSMLFFAVIVAPTVFHALDAGAAGVFLRRLFPRYYAWGLALSAVGTLLAAAAGAWPLLLFALLLVTFLYARQWLMPAINASRDADHGSRFRALHLRSVIINAVQMLGLLAFCGWMVAR